MSGPGIVQPPTDARDIALGRYMDAWSQLETAIRFVTQEIFQIDADVAFSIWSAVGTAHSIKLLDAAAKLKLNAEGVGRTKTICEKLARRNMRRNAIVHGSWRHKATLNFGTQTWEVGEWRRVYDHIDPDHPTDAPGYSFTVSELDDTTMHVRDMIEALWSLEEDLPKLRIQAGT